MIIIKAHIQNPNSKSIIFQYFEEFKQFIGYNDLPNFHIEYFDGLKRKGTNIASMIIPKNSYESYILEVEQLAHRTSQDFKAICYHEFTHLWDNFIMLKDKTQENKTRLLSLYTEYHATVIELMSLFKFESISSYKSISLYDKVYSTDLINLLRENKLNTLNNIKEMLEQISPDNMNKNAQLVDRIFKHTMYYFGDVIFCNKYCNENISEFLNITQFKLFLGDQIELIFDILCNNETLNINDFIRIEKLESDIIINILGL